MMLTTEQKRDWDENGFFIVRKFAPIAICRRADNLVHELPTN
jgi:hypothetical protein